MLIKRIGAFFIDILFISLFVGMVQGISFLNPHEDEYLEAVDKYDNLLLDVANGKIDYEQINNIDYDLNYYGASYNIITIISYISYFVLFQYFNKGQTLGKKLMKIKIINKDDTKVSFFKLLLREVIIFGLGANICNVILIFIISKSYYINISSIINLISNCFILLVMFLIIFRKDNLGLHDILFKTKVVRE